MLDKVRKSQSEILVINKNIASNLKRMRCDMVDVAKNSGVNQGMIASLLDQAIIMEQVLQVHFDHCYSSGNSIQLQMKNTGFTKPSLAQKLNNSSVMQS